MDKFVERIYLTEIINQSKFAMVAIQRMNTLIVSSNVDEFFRETTNLLQNAGSISLLLWPKVAKPNSKKMRPEDERRTYLRHKLGIGDSGHVLASRKLRNH